MELRIKPSSETDLIIIANRSKFNCLFNGKLSSVSKLIFLKSLPCSPFLPLFIVSASFLNPFQSSVYFFDTSLILTPIFFFNMSIYFANYQTQRISMVNIFTITNFFNCNLFNAGNINIFVRFFVYF